MANEATFSSIRRCFTILPNHQYQGNQAHRDIHSPKRSREKSFFPLRQSFFRESPGWNHNGFIETRIQCNSPPPFTYKGDSVLYVPWRKITWSAQITVRFSKHCPRARTNTYKIYDIITHPEYILQNDSRLLAWQFVVLLIIYACEKRVNFSTNQILSILSLPFGNDLTSFVVLKS